MRIAGRILPLNKRISISLRYIQGIGQALADEICKVLGFPDSKRAKDLTETEIQQVQDYIDDELIEKRGLKFEQDLRIAISENIRHLISNGSYRGKRHRNGLPVRGQNTKTNAKTSRKRARKV